MNQQSTDQIVIVLDELEPAWREAYSDPLNYVRVLHQKAVEVQRLQEERHREIDYNNRSIKSLLNRALKAEAEVQRLRSALEEINQSDADREGLRDIAIRAALEASATVPRPAPESHGL